MALFMNKEIHVLLNLSSGLQNQKSQTIKNQPYSHPENHELKKTQVQGSSPNFVGIKSLGKKEILVCQKVTKNRYKRRSCHSVHRQKLTTNHRKPTHKLDAQTQTRLNLEENSHDKKLC